MRYFFIFDVESVGLHGEGFAVAGGVFNEDGYEERGFTLCCGSDSCKGDDDGRKWIAENIPLIGATHTSPQEMRTSFWKLWKIAKEDFPGIVMMAECCWPVEARFLCACVDDDPSRYWEGPYPLHDVASVMLSAGMDPMAIYPRSRGCERMHHPRDDAKQSAMLLSIALSKLKNISVD